MARKQRRRSSKSELRGENKITNGKQTEGKPEGKPDQSDPKVDKAPETEKERETKATNDPEWYGRDPQLLIDAASVPFSEPFGGVVNLKSDSGLNLEYDGKDNKDMLNTNSDQNSVPGIAVLRVVPSYGSGHDRLSPMNVAATAIYTQVRYVNNGRKNYDPADLFLYVACVAELYSYINWLRRIYGLAFAYSQNNFYIGKNLLKADGINAENLIANLANFRYGINVLTNKIASYCVPADLTLFYKRAFQFASYYIEHDGDSLKDQLYLYHPGAFYKFQLDEHSVGMLSLANTQPSDPEGHTFESLLSIGDTLLENIWADEDFGLISGDVLRAFNGNILQLSPLPEDYVTLPVHDKAVLTQMENTDVVNRYNGKYTIAGDTREFVAGNVYQLGNGNLSAEHFGSFASLNSDATSNVNCNGVNILFEHLINVHEASGDPAMVIEAVQNKVAALPMAGSGITLVSPSAGNLPIRLDVCASYVDQVNIFQLTKNAQGAVVFDELTLATCYRRDMSQSAIWWLCNAIACFKYLPKIYEFTQHSESGWTYSKYSIKSLRVLSNLDTYARITNDQLRRLHEVSLLSLLYVPGVAKFINYSK